MAPNLDQFIWRSYKESVDEKSGNTEMTTFSIDKFLKILSKADINSVDMLFTPEDKIITNSNLWRELQANRNDILSKNCHGMIGYIKQQSSKYFDKVDRYDDLKRLSELLSKYDSDVKISETDLSTEVDNFGSKYVNNCAQRDDVQQAIEVCGKMYQTTANVSYLQKGVDGMLNKFGKRTKQGSMDGGDFKSLSHAYRVLIQLEEYIDTRNIIFPLVRADEIFEVKMGKVEKSIAIGKVSDYYDVVLDKLSSSDLQENANMENMRNAVMNYYGL
jgi:hypothetical protein